MHLLGPWTARKGKFARNWFWKAARQGHAKAKQYIFEHPEWKKSKREAEEIRKWTLELAEKGDPVAQYDHGMWCQFDHPSDISWFQKSADQGYLPAIDRLAWMFEIGIGVNKDEKKAVELYAKAAQLGDMGSQAALGIMYADGRGVPQDDLRATNLLCKPAEKGHGNAWVALGKIYEKKGTFEGDQDAVRCYQKPNDGYRGDGAYHLGRMYENGRGVKQDYAEAATCYLNALKAKGPYKDPTITFSFLCSALMIRDPDQLKRCKQAAVKGDASAQTAYGLSIINMLWGWTKKDQKISKWFEKSALQGNALGQYCWGMMIEYKLAPGGNKEALNWFRKSAENGVAEAQEALGRHHRTNAENVEAAKWYRLAAEQGQVESQYELGKMYAEGVGVAQDFQEAAKWCRLAFEWKYSTWDKQLKDLYYWERKSPRDDSLNPMRIQP